MNDAYFMQLMAYIEADITAISRAYYELEQFKEPYHPIQFRGYAHIVLADVEETQQEQLKRQRELFTQWYIMNERRIAEGKLHYTSTKVAE